MCPHQPPCPPADRPGRDAARTIACHAGQGWSLLCNGVIVFDDMGEILPPGRGSHHTGRPRPATRRGVKRENGRRTIMHPKLVTLFIQTDTDDLGVGDPRAFPVAAQRRRGRRDLLS